MVLPSIAAGGAAKTLMAVTIALHPATVSHNSGYVTVKPGDTLSSISQQQLGKAGDWPALWWANRSSVHDPATIRVGQRLKLSGLPKLTAKVIAAAQAASGAPAARPASSTSAAAVAAPEPAPAAVTTSYSGGGGFQSCVIAAESGGDAGAVNPYTGAGGLYGFLPSTWQALGYSGLPEDASVAEQNAAFAKEYAESGASAWSAYDGC
jgi:resuscitation-promoting factor RpfC